MITAADATAAAGTVTTQLGSLFTDLFAIAPIVVALGGFYIFWRYLTKKLSLR